MKWFIPATPTSGSSRQTATQDPNTVEKEIRQSDVTMYSPCAISMRRLP
jgi:hypothetical protein